MHPCLRRKHVEPTSQTSHILFKKILLVNFHLHMASRAIRRRHLYPKRRVVAFTQLWYLRRRPSWIIEMLQRLFKQLRPTLLRSNSSTRSCLAVAVAILGRPSEDDFQSLFKALERPWNSNNNNNRAP